MGLKVSKKASFKDGTIERAFEECLSYVGKRKSTAKLEFQMVNDLYNLRQQVGSAKLIDVLGLLLRKTRFGYNEITISPGVKQELSDTLKTAVENIRTYLKQLEQKDVIKHVDYDSYMINPAIVYLGYSEDRKVAIEFYKGLNEKDKIEDFEKQYENQSSSK